MLLTEHFDSDEFGCETEQDRQNYYLLCKFILEPLRARWGVIKITSGKRSAAKQEQLRQQGYKPSSTSQHLIGEAADFWCPYANGNMGQVYVYIVQDLRWPGEVIFYKRKGHIHVALPRYNSKADHYIIDE